MEHIRPRRHLGRAALAFGLTMISVVAYPATANAGAAKSLPTTQVGAGWGDNSWGQLGSAIWPGTSTYIDMSQPAGLQQISGGDADGLGITTGGTVYAWGANFSGQLGNGTTTGSSTPEQVPGLSGITQVAAGWNHSLALGSGGTVWAWGDNTSGELGDGTTTQRLTPVQVPGLTDVTQIAASDEWSLALRSDGTVWAWGSNSFDQMGTTGISMSDTPVQVPGLSRVSSIAAGGNFAMAVAARSGITDLHSVWTWGSDLAGALGNGTQCSCGYAAPRTVAGVGVPDVEDVAAGYDFAMVLGTDGTVWEWGDNSYGELGDGTTQTRLSPAEAIGLDSGITQVAAGFYHALALLSSGTVEGWGANQSGQLGDGATSTDSLAPVQVTGLASVSQIAAGGQSSFAVHTVLVIRHL